MKLLTKTTLYIATLSLFLFFLMGIIFFQVLKNISQADLNRELFGLKEVVEYHLSVEPQNLPLVIAGIDTLSIVKGGIIPVGEVFGDTVMFDALSNQFRTYRYLYYRSSQPGGPYQVKIFRSTTPTDQLVERVTLMMTLMVILFLAGIFFLNRFVFENLWKEFFRVLEKLRQFDTNKEPVVMEEQDIEEFMELGKVIEKMTRRLSSDYRELKEYTEHTTHELQTPLAVIRSKTELLLQSEKLGPEEMTLVESILAGTHQISRLSSTLTLITRIENRQFTERKEISIARLFERHLELLQELLDLRGITVERNDGADSMVKMDEGLADILATNLLKNAIVHNVEGGKIGLELDNDRLSIRNDGPPLPFEERELFRRFVRNLGKTGSFGLGLSLVKKICESYGFTIVYARAGNQHIFTLSFR
jgi:signal transduction histidine kinase